VNSVPAVLDEARRVLRKGAPFVFIEHVVAPPGRPLLRTAQVRRGHGHSPPVSRTCRFMCCIHAAFSVVSVHVLSDERSRCMAVGPSCNRRGSCVSLLRVAAWYAV